MFLGEENTRKAWPKQSFPMCRPWCVVGASQLSEISERFNVTFAAAECDEALSECSSSSNRPMPNGHSVNNVVNSVIRSKKKKKKLNPLVD
jgi:hypothetical protein